MFIKLALFSIILPAVIFPPESLSQTPPTEPGVSLELAEWRAANYRNIRYALHITLEKMAPLMNGEIEVRVDLTEEGAKRDLILDWRTTQFENDEFKPFARVVAVNQKRTDSSNESFIFFRREHLIISPLLLKKGENVIKIEFASPIKTSGAAVTRYVDKTDGGEYVYSLFVPSDASTAFPVFDQPDLKARFKLTVDMPNDWRVASNAHPEPVRVNSNFTALLPGNGTSQPYRTYTHSFEETQPISPYVFAFAAGNFERFVEEYADSVDSMLAQATDDWTRIARPLFDPAKTKIYVRRSQAEKFKSHAEEVFRLNREGVKFLENWFDHQFPFSKYDLVLIPEFPFGGMEHAGATFLREDRVIFPTEPTKNDLITRANVIFHEAAHQWFGDTVTMRWFDDLWLKEGFAEFMAYKTLEKVMPEANAWKVFYERNKRAAYQTDVTRGTTPIYQEIKNLSSAKSAYGNIVYRKAPSFLRQAEFFLGEREFQTAVRAFLKKHEYANASWGDLVAEFQLAKEAKIGWIGSGILKRENLNDWAENWVKKPGVPIIRIYADPDTPNAQISLFRVNKTYGTDDRVRRFSFEQTDSSGNDTDWVQKVKLLQEFEYEDGRASKFEYNGTLIPSEIKNPEKTNYGENKKLPKLKRRSPPGETPIKTIKRSPLYLFPNYQDYGYGIFLLDEKSRAFVLKNIQNERDDFLRSMMWGALWDSVRFYELAPEEYVKLVIRNIPVERDESTIATLLNRVSTAMTYYLSEPSAVAVGSGAIKKNSSADGKSEANPSAVADGSDLSARLENLLVEKMRNASTLGQRVTFYRSFVSNASTENARRVLKDILDGKLKIQNLELKTKDRFDIVARLIVLSDKDAPSLLAELEKTETDDAARRYAYAARAGIATRENKARYWKDFTENKEIPESWIEAALAVWNSPEHAELTSPFLEKALAELPNLKRERKIFFVNDWLGEFIGGQKSVEALNIINKFLADNPGLDGDLRLKILENSDALERAVKIRRTFSGGGF
ncbi:MAG: M1 family aminopeptidase [Pyrinomonadaceae bacterium]